MALAGGGDTDVVAVRLRRSTALAPARIAGRAGGLPRAQRPTRDDAGVAPTDDDSPETLADRVRRVHRSYATGVAVVTTAVDGQPYGLAVNAFSSVSLDPPLVLVCVSTTAQTHEHLLRGEHVGINFLAHDQVDTANAFARSGGDKFATVAWRPGESGVPILDGVAAHLEFRIQQRVEAGTHTIFIGAVLDADAPARPPLVYYDGRYFDGARLHPVD